MKAGDIQARLSATNTWWRGAGWERDDPDLAAAARAPFDYRPGVLDDLLDGGLYMLRGPRRVGKSTEVKRSVAGLVEAGVAPRRVIHCSVDGWRARELSQLVSAARVFLPPPEEGPRYWFLDEVSSVKGDWPSEIKWLRDNDPGFRDDTVVLTGSSSNRLDDAIKAFAGRRGSATDTDRVLLPMSFSDFCATTGLVQLPSLPELRVRDLDSAEAHEAIRDLAPWMSDLVTAWETYLHTGGYPQAVASWARERVVAESFTQALWDVVQGDALTGRELSPTQSLAILADLAGGLGSPLNVSHLARDTDVARATIDARLLDLQRSHLLWPVHREEGLLPSLRAQTKHYFTDPVLARMASTLGVGHPPDLTQLSEQQVGLAVLRNVEGEDPHPFSSYDKVLYHRTATGKEVDFVARQFADIAVESKYVDDRWGRDVQTLQASPWRGIIATRSAMETGRDASVLPAALLCTLLAP